VIPQSENKPEIATADGVREAKNRRVEIVLVCD
jgi:outer membrane protein OmpA-like peptidoglycan-associated protein